MSELRGYLLNKFDGFNIVDALQIVLLAVLISSVLIYTKKHGARSLSHFLIAYYVLAAVLSALKAFSNTVLVLLIFLPVLLIAVLFGAELKRDIFKASWKSRGSALHGGADVAPEEMANVIQQIVRAAQNISKQDMGALMIIVPGTISDHIIESGTRLDANVSCALVESIFYKNSPLHDGAVIIQGNKILAAGCYLPLSQSANIPKELGTRHRGAIGITEANPSVTAIVVSEETGIISAVYDGKIKRYLDFESLTNALEAAFMLKEDAGLKAFWRMDINDGQ